MLKRKKIAFIHLCAPYVSGLTYYENILPEYLCRNGFDVFVFTTKDSIDKMRNKIIYDKTLSHEMFNNITIRRLDYRFMFLPRFIYSRLRYFKKFLININIDSFDLVFINGLQFGDLPKLGELKKQAPKTKFFGELNSTFQNSANNLVTKFLLHKFFYNKIINQSFFIDKFYYGSEAAKKFSSELYNLSNEYDLLGLGVDEVKIRSIQKESKNQIKESFNIPKNKMILISGGKFDEKKNILQLIKAFEITNNPNLVLLLFGSVAKEISQEFYFMLKRNINVKFYEWLNDDEFYKLLFVSDLAIFPGSKSALWESAIGIGLPMVCQYWEGMEYIDLNGNIEYLMGNGDYKEISYLISRLYHNRRKLKSMQKIAYEKGLVSLSYNNIAKRILSDSLLLISNEGN
jgi:1,2-diacylglycerol 3-alpha-glucosyltransferase